jgi:hypothetical protein
VIKTNSQQRKLKGHQLASLLRTSIACFTSQNLLQFPEMPNSDLVIGTQLNEGVIYKATRDIFKHSYAEIRDRGVVNSLITNYSRTGTLMRQVVNKHGFDVVSKTVLKLLSDKVYESTTIARQRFPDLFEPPTSQKAVKAPTEGEATTTEQAAVNGVDKAVPSETRDILKSQDYPVIVQGTSCPLKLGNTY